MNIKKAIQVLEIEQGGHVGVRYREYFDEIIDLLKRGEKYEKIVNELENCLLPKQYKNIVGILKRRYFPKDK